MRATRSLTDVASAFLWRLEELACPEAIGTELHDCLADLGFSSVVCFYLPAHCPPCRQCVLFSSRPAAWIDTYIAHNYVAFDPLLVAIRHHRRPVSWSEVLSEQPLDMKQRELFAARRAFGMDCGLCVPIFETGGALGIVSAAGQGIDICRERRHATVIVGLAAYSRLVAYHGAREASETGERKRDRSPSLRLGEKFLRGREREVLYWIAQGKSDWEIAQILKISPKTVNFHVENAKRRLGVPTRIRAVMLAMELGDLKL